MNHPDAAEAAKRARAEARAAWPVETFGLTSVPNDDLSASTTPEARLAMMWPLALEVWGLTGRPLPTYERRHCPVSVR